MSLVRIAVALSHPKQRLIQAEEGLSRFSEPLRRLPPALHGFSEPLSWIGEAFPRPVESSGQTVERQLWTGDAFPRPRESLARFVEAVGWVGDRLPRPVEPRSEERRVGKECRSRGSTYR